MKSLLRIEERRYFPVVLIFRTRSGWACELPGLRVENIDPNKVHQFLQEKFNHILFEDREEFDSFLADFPDTPKTPGLAESLRTLWTAHETVDGFCSFGTLRDAATVFQFMAEDFLIPKVFSIRWARRKLIRTRYRILKTGQWQNDFVCARRDMLGSVRKRDEHNMFRSLLYLDAASKLMWLQLGVRWPEGHIVRSPLIWGEDIIFAEIRPGQLVLFRVRGLGGSIVKHRLSIHLSQQDLLRAFSRSALRATELEAISVASLPANVAASNRDGFERPMSLVARVAPLDVVQASIGGGAV